jgi:hypothetical protein
MTDEGDKTKQKYLLLRCHYSPAGKGDSRPGP